MVRLVLRSVALTAAAGLLAACSSMPEWTKPTTWYDGVTGAEAPAESSAEAKPASTSDQQPAQATQAAAKPETAPPVDDPLNPGQTGQRIQTSDKPTEFPNVAAQPAPREPSTTESQRREIRDSLVADRDRAQHTADELRGGTMPAAAPPPPAATTAAPAVDQKTKEEKPADE